MALKKAFSLIELIVVIGLLSLLMLAISSTMLMTMISSNRIRTTTKVKQAGNYAVGEIQSLVRGAKEIASCDSTNDDLSLVNADGGTTDILLESARIASNSGNYLTPSNLTVSSFSLTCLPSDVATKLIKLSFDLKDSQTGKRATENPLLHFETSVSIRNE